MGFVFIGVEVGGRDAMCPSTPLILGIIHYVGDCDNLLLINELWHPTLLMVYDIFAISIYDTLSTLTVYDTFHSC